MKGRYWSRVFVVLALLLAFSLGGGIADAAPKPQQGITLSPTSLSQVIQPGAAYSGALQIVNNGRSAYEFHIYATPYGVSNEDYSPDFTALPGAPKVASWFKFSTTEAYIKPGQTVTVKYTISLPKNIQPGGYYAVAFAETQLPKKTSKTSISLNERVGEIFYLQGAGPVAQRGELLTWEADMFQKPPLLATLRLEDSGGLNYPATIQVKVEDILGQPKYTSEIVKQVLPQTIRRIPITWSGAPSIGIFKVSGRVSFLNQSKALPTKWVLVMSQTARIYVLLMLVALVLIFTGDHIYNAYNVKFKHNKHMDDKQ